MRSFIDEVVSSLYGRYGDDISSLNLVFPSRRARLFFSDALSRVTLRPVWQPRFVGINDLMQQISGIVCGDRIKLVTELYKVYSRHHDESFDEFYFWGDMLLSDFDQIDKYLIDADVLFTNIGDLHALEDHLAYLTPEQIGIVSRFWQSFGAESNFSDEKARFMSIWRTLGTIYHEYRAALSVQGLAYEGMVHRIAAERIAADDLPDEFPAPREPLRNRRFQRVVRLREAPVYLVAQQRTGRILVGLQRIIMSVMPIMRRVCSCVPISGNILHRWIPGRTAVSYRRKRSR